MRRSGLADPVVCVLWSTAGSSFSVTPDGDEVFRNLGAHWMIGFHERAKICQEDVAEIEGVPFAFDREAARLDGGTLDYVQGRFVVTERAI